MIEVVRDSNLIRRLRSSVAWPEKRSESTRFEAWVNPHFGTWRQLVKKKGQLPLNMQCKGKKKSGFIELKVWIEPLFFG